MEKKKFVLRISKKMYEQIERWAGDEFRSVNGQIEWIIQDSLKRHKRISGSKKHQNTQSSKGETNRGDDSRS
jgi:hypothetical protein